MSLTKVVTIAQQKVGIGGRVVKPEVQIRLAAVPLAKIVCRKTRDCGLIHGDSSIREKSFFKREVGPGSTQEKTGFGKLATS
jgi:hypothetical protein